MKDGATAVAPPGRVLLLAAVTEKAWRAQVVLWANRAGWLSYFTWSSLHSPGGFPDLVLCRPPRVIVAELKTMRGRVSSRQQLWLNRLDRCPGVEVYVWRPSDEAKVQGILGHVTS